MTADPKPLECDGWHSSREKCKGKVRRVHITLKQRVGDLDYGIVNYCPESIATDRHRGFTVAYVKEQTDDR